MVDIVIIYVKIILYVINMQIKLNQNFILWLKMYANILLRNKVED